MGLFLSVIISYAGILEAIETIKHILSGLIPETDPDFQDLIDYYTKLLQKSANPSSSSDWTEECGQGYLYLTEDKNGNLKSAAVKYYGGQPNSTAILFSTKISSFGQDSVDDITTQANGDYKSERSLDGIKFRPLQRSDPSGRRRSFKKRHSSSSNSSKESRASRDEELKMFTSLEETEFERMNNDENYTGFGSTPNLAPRSYSRSRSRENSKEGRYEAWSVEASVDSLPDDDNTELKPRMKDLANLDSFEEEKDDTKDKEVTEEDEDVDFWGNGD